MDKQRKTSGERVRHGEGGTEVHQKTMTVNVGEN